MEIFDNVLSKRAFKRISDYFIGDRTDVEYRLCNDAIKLIREGESPIDTYQFVHSVASNGMVNNTKSLEVLAPLLLYIKPVMVQRIKVNITPRTSYVVENGMHSDIEPKDCPKDCVIKSCIFYLNDNDGYTSFETGDQVESVENRLLTFDATKLHSGSTCTNKNYRAIVNCVYI